MAHKIDHHIKEAGDRLVTLYVRSISGTVKRLCYGITKIFASL